MILLNTRSPCSLSFLVAGRCLQHSRRLRIIIGGADVQKNSVGEPASIETFPDPAPVARLWRRGQLLHRRGDSGVQLPDGPGQGRHQTAFIPFPGAVFLDIGTPDDYAKAPTVLQTLAREKE